MPLDLNKTRKYPADFDFSKLFIEELDFIINYDTRLRRGLGGQVKYRMGRDGGEAEG